MLIRNKIKKITVLLMMLLLIFLNAGCWDSIDINKQLIITTIMLDLKDDEIIIYFESANTNTGISSSNGSSCEKYCYNTTNAKTLPEMRDFVDQKICKPIYLSGVSSLILTENFAKKYLVEYLYRLKSDEKYRKKINTSITKEDPQNLIDLAKEKSISVGVIVEDLITTLNELGKSFSRSTMRLLENLSSKYCGILIPCMGIKNDSIALIGYSVVNGTTVTGFLPVEEANETIYLKQKKVKFEYIFPYKDVDYTIEVILNKRKIKPYYSNNNTSFNIAMDLKAQIVYGNKKTPYGLNEDDLKVISQIIKQSISEKLYNSVYRAKNEFECDYFQFDDIFRMKYPKQYYSMDWITEFKKASVDIDVKVNTSIKWSIDYEFDKIN